MSEEIPNDRNSSPNDGLSDRQRELKAKHGPPAEFAAAAYECVPGYASMDEAPAAVDKYNAEWRAAL